MKRQKLTSIRDIGDLEFDEMEEELLPSQTTQRQTPQQTQQAPQPSGAAGGSSVSSQPQRPSSTYHEMQTPQPISSTMSYSNIINILDRIHPVERAAIMLKYAETDAVIRKLTINEILDYLQRYNIPSDILKVIKMWAEIKEHGK